MTNLTDTQFEIILKQRCIALTGGVATGKSTVAKLLKELGYIVIDADHLARKVVEPQTSVFREVVKSFGPDILAKSGTIDRDRLRQLVMTKPSMRKQLENIIHPAIQQQFKTAVEEHNLDKTPTTFFYEAALIFEAARNHLFKEVWATYCPPEIQLARLCSRSNLSQTEALALINNQMPALKKAELADHIIDTNTTLDTLRQGIIALL
jgi:dephospho-CoA kinase